MAINDDIASLKTVLAAVVTPMGLSAIKRIYTPSEKTVTTAELPCYLITWKPGGKPQMMTFGGTYKLTINYVISFLYKPLGQGTLFDNTNDINSYVKPTLTALYSHIQLYSTVLGQYPIQVTPAMELPITWAGQGYFGFDTTVMVMEQTAATFGS